VARHAPAARVIDLDDTYRRLARPWDHEELAANRSKAYGHGGRLSREFDSTRPIRLLATAIPPSATASTAITTIHAMPRNVEGGLPEQLLETAERNVARALHRCDLALELHGAEHGYTVEDWLPTVCDIAGPLLESARLDTEPPTLVQLSLEAISWLSRAIAELDDGSEEAAASLAETLARLLAVWSFTDALRRRESL
jgi:hypothetical protein